MTRPPPVEHSYRESIDHPPHLRGKEASIHDVKLDQLLEDLLGSGHDAVDDGLVAAFVNVERAKREWEATVDALPELICVIDEDGMLLRANRTVERWSLGPVVNVRGHELHHFLHPSCGHPCTLEGFLQIARKRALAGDSMEQEYYDEVLRRHLQVRVRPVRRKEHDLHRHVAVILHDITQRREMESALKRHNERLRVLNVVSSAILAAQGQEEIAEVVLEHVHPLVPYQQAYVLLRDRDGSEFQVLASAIEEARDASPEDAISARAFGSNLDRSTSEMFLVGDLDQQRELSQFEKLILDRGSRSYISTPLSADNRSMGVLTVAMDSLDDFTTEHIHIVREAAEMLTVAIRQSQLYHRLQKTNDELQGLLRDRYDDDQVRFGSSHAASVGRQLVQRFQKDDLFGPLTAGQILKLDELRGEGERLLFMVNGLFRVRRIDASSLEKVCVDPGAFLEEEIEAWRIPVTNQEVTLLFEKEAKLPKIVVDPVRVRQALSFLLDSALTNSGQGDEIVCRVWHDKDELLFSVSDRGKAISPGDLDQMFSRFHRSDKGSAHVAIRLGLGLMRCEEIVKAHGGQIWIESSAKKFGNTFVVALPGSPDSSLRKPG